MQSMAVMVMTTMDTAWGSSFLEAEGEVAVAVVAEVVEVVEVGRWDPRGEGMVLHPAALNTGLLCQVGAVVFLTVFSKCGDDYES